DIHTTTPARPEITLVFHAGPPLPQHDTDHPTNPDSDEPDRDEPDRDAPEASEPVDDTAENEPDGDEPDGEEPDGDEPDGDEADGDVAETGATRVDDEPGGRHPADTTIETPIETPAETPSEFPSEFPTEFLTESPAATTIETPAETAARIRRGLFGALGVTDEHGVRLQDGTKRIVLCDHEPAAPSGPNPTAAEDPTPPRHLVPDLLARLACANGGLACGEGGDVGRVVGADVQFDD
ncbi:MAG: hypothetical protein HYX32_08065, partial [Actinobacteria bacterium]|nr:hypothetical protein [Actinomycetota bacterium]